MSDPCRWDGERRVTARHLRDCNTSGCGGCEPCTQRHCDCRRHLRADEPRTCARCVGATRGHLERIDDLCRLAPIAATERGIGSALMVLAGPVPEHSTHSARRAWAHGGALCRCPGDCPDQTPMPAGPVCKDADDKARPCAHHACRRRTYRPTCPGLADWLEYADDEQHPLWVLGTWDFLVAEHLEHVRRDRVTITSAVTYLDSNLTYLAQDDGFAFDEFARELRGCAAHVEQLMGVAAFVQLGAPCPTCNRTLELHHGLTEKDDRWRCPSPACEGEWTQGEYDQHVYRRYLDRAEHLTAPQILAQYRVPEGSVRGWAARGEVRKRGRDQSGRQLYDVADTLACRDRKQAG